MSWFVEGRVPPCDLPACAGETVTTRQENDRRPWMAPWRPTVGAWHHCEGNDVPAVPHHVAW